ncbi:MAG: sodium:solute symporter family protein [Candidatus Aminicenantes bacterium]|nr:sodium:solute symporter family protein [Candidatus Aminicenantes bacterium]
MWYLYVILVYFLVLTGLNFFRARKIKTQEDFMVAGRSLNIRVMVFTLICTWIGSGTFIAGAEYAARAGFSSLWMPAGAWVGIIVIYFLASKIRTFGQYTVGDILEVRYGKFARLFGALALIISFTAIVSYQFRAGGYILNVITEGKITVPQGQFWTAVFVILFTALGGMVAVAYTDLPNGIIILIATIAAVPFVIHAAGGLSSALITLPPEHFTVINETFGTHPMLKAGSYFLATMLLLLGVQTMYQKFYSAKTPKDAKVAVSLWVVGTIIVETVVVVIAVFAASRYWPEINAWLVNHKTGIDPASIVLVAAKKMVPPIVGLLLMGAASVVVLSTGMNYLLSPTTNIMRDIYQRFLRREASQREMVALQRIMVLILGVIAWLLAVKMESVLNTAYFAYTIYGASITPALIAALAWKRATRAGGLWSIILGSVTAIALKVFSGLYPQLSPEGDPFGIPIIYPAFLISILALIIISYMTKPPSKEEIASLFPDEKK